MLFVVVPEEIQAGVPRGDESGFEISARTVPEYPAEMDREKFRSEEVDQRPRSRSCGITSISGRGHVGILLRICSMYAKTNQIKFSRRHQS